MPNGKLPMSSLLTEPSKVPERKDRLMKARLQVRQLETQKSSFNRAPGVCQQISSSENAPRIDRLYHATNGRGNRGKDQIILDVHDRHLDKSIR
jgi:hypothetical protein